MEVDIVAGLFQVLSTTMVRIDGSKTWGFEGMRNCLEHVFIRRFG
jgi:hypothetical protein